MILKKKDLEDDEEKNYGEGKQDIEGKKIKKMIKKNMMVKENKVTKKMIKKKIIVKEKIIKKNMKRKMMKKKMIKKKEYEEEAEGKDDDEEMSAKKLKRR